MRCGTNLKIELCYIQIWKTSTSHQETIKHHIRSKFSINASKTSKESTKYQDLMDDQSKYLALVSVKVGKIGNNNGQKV